MSQNQIAFRGASGLGNSKFSQPALSAPSSQPLGITINDEYDHNKREN